MRCQLLRKLSVSGFFHHCTRIFIDAGDKHVNRLGEVIGGWTIEQAGLTAGAVGGTAGNGTGALVSAVQGGGTGNTVDVFNRQLRWGEAQKLTELKKNASADEVEPLDAAACALARCAEGVPAQ